MTLWVHQSLLSWLWLEDWASLARKEDFPIPCPAFRCSLICRLYFYLPFPPAPGLSFFTWHLMSGRRGKSCLCGPAAPIRGLSTGDWATCPPLAPRACLLSTFPWLAPRRRLTHCLSPPRLSPPCLVSLTSLELVELHREQGRAKGLLSPEGWLQSLCCALRKS